MAARSLGTGAATAMNLLRLISHSQLTRPTSVVYGEGVSDEEDGAAVEALARGLWRRWRRRNYAGLSRRLAGRAGPGGEWRGGVGIRAAAGAPPPCRGAWLGGNYTWPSGRAGPERCRASTGHRACRAVPAPCSCLPFGPRHGPWAVWPCRPLGTAIFTVSGRSSARQAKKHLQKTTKC
jgi:hypothetical protein